MPSIETLYPQDAIGNMGDKRDGVDLILSDKCLLQLQENGGSQSLSNHDDTDVIEAKESKVGDPTEGSQKDGDRPVGEGVALAQNDLVIVEIEVGTEEGLDLLQRAREEGEKDQQQGPLDKESPGQKDCQKTPEVSCDSPSRSCDKKKIDLDSIFERICPGFSSSRSKKLKAKLSEVLGKAAPLRGATIPTKEPVKEADSGKDLSDRFDDLALTDEEDQLKSKGPGMRGGMGVSDLPGAYSPRYAQSPGQWSPQHDSMTNFTTIGGDMTGKQPGMMDYPWPQSNMSYYPVSPPATTYPQTVSVSDMESIYSAQSPADDGLQDIPTVMATAMQVIVPGQLEPNSGTQSVSGTWGPNNSGPPSVAPSPLSVDYSTSWRGPPSVPSPPSGDFNNMSSREFQEQGWPESSPLSSLHCNPPSVGSTSDGDSVFSYNAAMSPAGSTGSMVHSPAAPPPGYPQAVGSPHQYNITSSTNSNFGIVQVKRSSTSSCPSPPRDIEEARIQKIADMLQEEAEGTLNQQKAQPQPPSPYMVDRAQPSPPSPYMGEQHQMAPRQHHYGQLPQQPPQNTIPGIHTILSPNDGCTRAMNRRTARNTPYERRPAPCMVDRRFPSTYQVPEQPCVRVSDVPMYRPQVEPIVNVNSADSYRHQQWAQQLSAEQLLECDTNDPYEGENMLQKLILNQMVEQSMTVVQRMAQLGLDLNATNDQHQSALLLAVINNMPQVVYALVQNNADVLRGDKKGTFPIHYAASHGFVEVIDALECGSSGAHLDKLDFNGKTPLMCAVQAHGTEQRFYENGEEIIRLVDNAPMAMRLIELGADPTMQDASSGKTALHYAISEVKRDMIQIILEGDQTLRVARVAMSDGNTPLHLAAALKCDKTAPWGQQRTCDQQTKCSIIQYLVSKGAEIAAPNVEKNKPLDYVTAGHTQVKECLEQFSKNSKKR